MKGVVSVIVFTFHYVSIKSNAEKILDLLDEHLHSTMFLLNRIPIKEIKKGLNIYIPLCFY